jgi:aryl-alcohol dehydrogenase-like predicted oxidoreductase
MPNGRPAQPRRLTRKWIIQEVENSLRRLKTDYIDLYQCTAQPATDVEGDPRRADRPRAPGQIPLIGSSSYSASQIVEAQWASTTKLARFVTEQPPYSILVRGIEQDILPTTQRYGMGTLVYSPLCGGWLTGRWRKDAPGSPTSAARPSARFDMTTAANQRKLDVVEELALLAEQSGMTMIDLALAWAINHPGVTSAIIGPRTMEQLQSQLPSAEVTLNAEILDRVDELVAPGVTLNADDNSYGADELTPEARRR